jgi:hypothetical protein
MVEIVGIGITAGDSEDACTQDVGQRMGDLRRVTVVGDDRGQPVGEAKLLFGTRQQDHPAIGTDQAAIERGGDFFAVHRWQ